MEDKNSAEKKLTVRAVERSLDILSCFINERELSLTDIAKRISLHKSTVFRLLNTLEKKGFLLRNPETDKYRLGYRIWELSSNLVGMDDPAILFLPEMIRLRDLIGETVSLYVRDGVERIRIQAVESNQAIRRVAPIGDRMPLSVGASSKVLLAFAKLEVRETLLAQLASVHVLELGIFTGILTKVKRKGYATSFEEREIGAAAISTPILSRSNELIAALSVSGPVNRLNQKKLEEIAPIIKESASLMGRMLR